MRSLTLKLTVAFVLIGVLSVILFGVLLGYQTRTAFERFVVDRERAFVVDGVRAFAERRDDKSLADSVDALLDAGPVPDDWGHNAIIANAAGTILRGPPAFRPGTQLTVSQLAAADSIVANGKTVGYVTFAPEASQRDPLARSPMEAALRQRVNRAALGAGIFAMLAGLAVSGLLARSFSRPITELTQATRAMAAGNLHQQVPVRTQDELGVLAHSFNQMSADLARSTQARRQMTADLAHDLRTPLTVLRGYSEGLLEGRLTGSPRVFSVMFDEVAHLQRLVEELRTLSLADAGELTLNRRRVDPSALLERAGLAHMQSAIERGLTLRVEAAAGLPDVEVDTDRMTQVLNNLVANALRFTETGEVVLAARATGAADAPTALLLEVRDTGAGIAAADLPFVFERFYRADKARTRADESTGAATGNDAAQGDSSGLGLAIARAIVEAHGGAISVASIEGQGSTFTISLPPAAA